MSLTAYLEFEFKRAIDVNPTGGTGNRPEAFSLTTVGRLKFMFKTDVLDTLNCRSLVAVVSK